ncbi:macrophage mannose receptor 1-like [Labeo rohita]|uniref:macrophage mannose receptor 1-like n=1 Tax=Labeo rohita TaxID=84645 RepID=UPI0021E3030C|nr:macrophage mannose receptor 1-like [Labeo rohita]
MEQRLIRFFLLSGLLSVILCVSRQYILIKEYKTWDEAQDYCRQNYIDLATVQTDEEWSEVDKLRNEIQFYIWIGLYDDVDTWRWSFQNENVTFLGWDSDQPNNLNGKQYCVNLRTTGYWWDEACDLLCSVFCQSGEGQPVLVTDPVMSWNDAQNYCRENDTDLFTIRNVDVNQQLTTMIKGHTCAWIGLFRDSWKWSGQNDTSSSLRWAAGQPDNFYGGESCAALDNRAQIADESCSTLYYFLCQASYVKHQILKLKVKAGDNVNDQAIAASVLYKIQQKLREQGMAADVKLSWRWQLNGKVFQKLHNETESQTLPTGSTDMNIELSQ